MRTFFCASLIAFVLALTSCNPPREDEFAQWLADNNNRQATAALTEYLKINRVGDVIAVEQLLRSDTQWRRCNAKPFAIPQKEHWPNMVLTLRVIRDEVQPIIGPIEAVSVFRSPDINRCIKGANRSYHLQFRAIDMRPAKNVSRADLIEKLCALHARKGKKLNMGLGIYKGTRFHIDTAGYRRWGHDHTASTSPCASFVAPQRKNR